MREAIDILREYDVSQMPVVKAEPPVVIAEVVGSVVERDLLERCSPGTPGWPTRSSGTCPRRCRWSAPASRSTRRSTALEKADAAVVLADGKPAGVLTRQDLLTHLSR